MCRLLCTASPLARPHGSRQKASICARCSGSGPGGRIVRKDVEAFLSQPPAAGRLPASQPAAAAPAAPVTATPGVDKVVPLTRLRAAIGRRMVESQAAGAAFLRHPRIRHGRGDGAAQADQRPAARRRKALGQRFHRQGRALALREFPNLNASIDLARDQIVRHGQVNVGVAVAVEGGLLTVVCRDADRKPLRQIAGEVRGMVERARDGKVRPEDIEGSTFSISNLGMFDVEHFIAIINPPEAAILAVGSAQAGAGGREWRDCASVRA